MPTPTSANAEPQGDSPAHLDHEPQARVVLTRRVAGGGVKIEDPGTSVTTYIFQAGSRWAGQCESAFCKN